MPPTIHSSIKDRQSGLPPNGYHPCPECSKTYERTDHLARHLESHRNERNFLCSVCNRGFNRRDVLQRHQAVHAREYADDRPSLKRGQQEALQFSDTSRQNAAPDNEDHHSKRLRHNNGIEAKGFNAGTRSTPISVISDTSVSFNTKDANDVCGSGRNIPEFSTKNVEIISSSLSHPNSAVHPTQVPPYVNHEVTDHELVEYPYFFQQVMFSSPSQNTNEIPTLYQPRGIFDFMHENESHVLENDISWDDFLSDLDDICHPELYTCMPVSDECQDISTEEERSASQRRAEAFRRSFWLWVPEKNQNAFSDQEGIPLRESDTQSVISNSHGSSLDQLNIQGKLSRSARDDIFRMVAYTSRNYLTVTNFPDFECLDMLIKIGVSKRTETDAWIHPYTLYSKKCRPEFLTALVSAGCICCGLPSVSKTGLILQEIVRLAQYQLVEHDNSVLRDLQYLQAEMLWLDMGIFCGYKRKMHIAESNLQHLTTALRRAGAFERSFYSSVSLPGSTEDGKPIENIWLQWVEQESLKRLVYHLFEHDHEVAMAMNRPAITSYTELTLPFPAPRELWLAQTASSWKRIWLEKYCDMGISDICPRDITADPSLLSNLPRFVDPYVVSTTLLHGLASQVCDFQRQVIITQYNVLKPRATVSLWLQSRQDDLYFVLRDLKDDYGELPALITMFYQFVMLYLNINMDIIQRFVGKFGEVEARKAYFLLREWGQTKEARCAVWHAGQIFRIARQVPPYQLRGFDSIVIYHAALILWVYALLKCGESKHTAQPTHGCTDRPIASSSAIYLDQEENSLTRAFLAHGSGRPGVTLPLSEEREDGQSFQFCGLNQPRDIMAVALQIYESHTPLMPGQILPPLISNIRELVRDLGSLP